MTSEQTDKKRSSFISYVLATVSVIADVLGMTGFILGLGLFKQPPSSEEINRGSVSFQLWQNYLVRGISFAIPFFFFIVVTRQWYNGRLQQRNSKQEKATLLSSYYHNELIRAFNIETIEEIGLYEIVYPLSLPLISFMFFWMSVFVLGNPHILVSSVLIFIVSIIFCICNLLHWKSSRIFTAMVVTTFILSSAFVFSLDVDFLVGLTVIILVSIVGPMLITLIGLVATTLLYRLLSSLFINEHTSKTHIVVFRSSIQEEEKLNKLSPAERSALCASQMKHRDVSGAVAHLSEALRLEPRLEWHKERAKLYTSQNKHTEAAADYKSALSLAKDNIEKAHLHEYMAQELLEAGKYDEALDQINAAIEISPKADSYYTKSLIYYYLDDYHRAIQNGNIALSLSKNDDIRRNISIYNDNSAHYHLIVGNSYMELNDYRNALKHLIVAADNLLSKGHIGVIKSLQALNDHNAAIEIADLFIKRTPDDFLDVGFDLRRLGFISGLPEVYYLRAKSHKAIGEIQKARSDIQECLNRDAKCYKAYFLLGWMAWEIGELDEARRNFQYACELTPSDFTYWRVWVLKELSIKNYDGVKDIINQAVQLEPRLKQAFRTDSSLSKYVNNT